MVEFLSRFNAGELIALVSIVGGLMCGTLVMAADYWLKIRKAEINVRLKQDMLERGMSAAEMQAVLDVGTKKRLAE
jgi:hypothetical protein